MTNTLTRETTLPFSSRKTHSLPLLKQFSESKLKQQEPCGLRGSLAVFLLASVVAIVVIRTQIENWPNLPPVPTSLWWSTGFIVASTIAMQKIKRVWNPAWMWTSIVLILLFLLFQILAALQWHEALSTVAESD